MTAELAPAAPARAPGIALCAAEGDPEDWFPPQLPGRRTYSAGWVVRIAGAKRVCHRCPVRSWCLDTFAAEPHGIVGGLLPEERGWPTAERDRVRLALKVAAGNTTGPGAEAPRPEAERKEADQREAVSATFQGRPYPKLSPVRARIDAGRDQA